MKKRLTTLLLVVLMAFPVLVAGSAHAADRVRCDFRGGYKVTCYNNTPYRVHVRLNMFTECGLRIKYFTILNYTHSVYSSCYINRITWRWQY